MYHLRCATLSGGKFEELDVDEHHITKLKRDEVLVLKDKVGKRQEELKLAEKLVKRVLDGPGERVSGPMPPENPRSGAIPARERSSGTYEEEKEEGRHQVSFAIGTKKN